MYPMEKYFRNTAKGIMFDEPVEDIMGDNYEVCVQLSQANILDKDLKVVDFSDNYYAIITQDKFTVIYTSYKQTKIIEPSYWEEKDIRVYHLYTKSSNKFSISDTKLRNEVLEYVANRKYQYDNSDSILEHRIKQAKDSVELDNKEYEEFIDNSNRLCRVLKEKI